MSFIINPYVFKQPPVSPELSVFGQFTFDDIYADSISVCMMDDIHAIVCYKSSGSNGYARCLSIVDDEVVIGDRIAFTSSGTYNANLRRISVCRMDNTHAIVFNAIENTACCLELNGTTITVEDTVTVTSGTLRDVSICSLNSTTAIVSYCNYSNIQYGYAVCLTLSGTDITVGVPTIFHSTKIREDYICAMDSNSAIVSYGSYDTTKGYVCHLSLSGTNVVSQTPVVFSSDQINYSSICRMDDTHAIVAAQNSTLRKGMSFCITLFGVQLTVESNNIFHTTRPSENSISSLDSEYSIVGYLSNVNPYYGHAWCISLDGTVMNNVTDTDFTEVIIYEVSNCTIDNRRVLSCYSYGGGKLGVSCILMLSL